jgi:hypothetical protein
MYVNGKMRHVKTIPRMEWVNSSMIYLIYCKNFCKCHNVPQQNNKIILLYFSVVDLCFVIGLLAMTFYDGRRKVPHSLFLICTSFIIFFYFCTTGDLNSGLARQALYHLSHCTSPFCFGYF